MIEHVQRTANGFGPHCEINSSFRYYYEWILNTHSDVFNRTYDIYEICNCE